MANVFERFAGDVKSGIEGFGEKVEDVVTGGAKTKKKRRKRAAEAQEQARLEQKELIEERLPGIRSDLLSGIEAAASQFDPFIEQGLEAQKVLSSALGFGGEEFDPGVLTGSPQFQFAQQQGLQAGERSLAASGLRQSGRAAKELSRFSSGLATSTFDSFLSRISQITQQGQQAAGGRAGILAGGAQQVAQLDIQSLNQLLGNVQAGADIKSAEQIALGEINAQAIQQGVSTVADIAAGIATGGSSLAVTGVPGSGGAGQALGSLFGGGASGGGGLTAEQLAASV